MRAICLLLALSACAHQINDYPQQPQLVVRHLLSDATIHVEWVKDVDEVKKSCPSFAFPYACSSLKFVDGKAVCTIYAVEPKDFNDGALLAIFGHEAWHCFGARHE